MPVSQIDVGVLSNFLTPRGYEQIDISDALAHSLTIPDINTPLIAFIQGDDGDVRFRDDGTTPTGTMGYLIFENSNRELQLVDLSSLQVIQPSINGATKVNVNYYSYADLNEVPNPIVPISPFCALQTLSEIQPPNNTTVIYNQNSYSVTNIAGGIGFGTAGDLTKPFILNNDIFVFEATILTNTNLSGFANIYFVVSDINLMNAYLNGLIVSFGNGTNGQIQQVALPQPVLISGLTLTVPYTLHIEVHGDTGIIDYTDGINSGSTPLPVPLQIAGTQQLVTGFNIIPPDQAGDEVSLSINSGSSPFVFPLINPSAKTYCEL